MVSSSEFKFVSEKWESPWLCSDSAIEVEKVELYARQNASNHRTDKYDLVADSAATVLRRSAPFFLAVVTKNRPADLLNRYVLLFC